jgi:3-oxoacyl-[acyl-carrier protein] reductase
MVTGSAGRAARVAVVTGGSRGIGRACAERLAREGVAVVVTYAQRKTEAEAVVTLLEGSGTSALAVQADVADEHAVAKVFELAEKTFGGVDVVVHAAGQQVLAPLVELDLRVLDDLMRTNIRGTFVVDQQAARRVRRGGSIVNMSSSSVGRPLLRYAGYAATKGAVDAISLILAAELRGRDINVNAVAPGPTVTEMFVEGRDEATLARVAQASPLERMGMPEDIAELVAFLTSPAGHWVNGQRIRANGGIL